MSHSKCESLFEASKALLNKSGLARWDGQTLHFVPLYAGDDDSEFEKHWKKQLHSEFGRYMAWVLFSVGAENLAKAACVCNGIVQGETIPLKYPRYTDSISMDEWVDRVIDGNWLNGDPISATQYNYKTLGNYWRLFLPELCKQRGICCKEKRHLIASYKYFTESIRNRDAHTYIEDERRNDFPTVEPVFVPAFNILVAVMRKNHHFDQ